MSANLYLLHKSNIDTQRKDPVLRLSLLLILEVNFFIV